VKTFCAAISLALMTSAAIADVMLDSPLDKEISAAGLVAEARIVEISAKCAATRCRDAAYRIEVQRNLYVKDWMGEDWIPPKEAVVCAQPGLDLGQTYVFLLSPVKEVGTDNPNTEVDEGAGKCMYSNNLGAIFFNHGSSYYRVRSPESIELVKDERGTFLTQGKLQEGFIERIEQLSRPPEKK